MKCGFHPKHLLDELKISEKLHFEWSGERSREYILWMQSKAFWLDPNCCTAALEGWASGWVGVEYFFVVVFFLFGRWGNFESHCLIESFWTLKSSPRCWIWKGVSFFYTSVSTHILFLCHALFMLWVCVVLLCRWLGGRGGCRWNMDYLLSVSG